MVSADEHRVETVGPLKDSICARNTFQSLFALLLPSPKTAVPPGLRLGLFHLPTLLQ